MAEVLRLLQQRGGADDGVDIAVAGAAALAVDGLAVSLAAGSGRSEVLWCSDETSRVFEDLQFTLGEGPGPDCLASATAVRIPDLARVRQDRWPALIMEAPDQAARAVFCFPLRIGAIAVGVLTAVRRAPGRLTHAQTDDALALAAALTMRVLARGQPEVLPRDDAASLPFLQHAVVHQATGMVSVQLAVPLAEALLRLRAHAYSSRRTLTETARDIVARRLRLAPGTEPLPPAADKDPTP
ncbi:ANTAR domain-containing protein [Streptomyces polygonati]|uniref:ANTAR domain-containing protein n=1 Tax=Streptomyces polygonati TaxID=1617087 RepID=A0ABV8HW35_9ACTN